MQKHYSRILMSLGMIVFVGALAVGSTGAFFSDTETSTGNTFAAGDIDIQIDNESYVTSTSGETEGSLIFSPSTSWAMNNLTDQLFFNFTDVKPGDFGEDTISVHVGSNNGWACMALDVTATPENTLVDPETDAGDVGPANGDNGELQKYLHFTFWKDDGDNVFEEGEQVISTLDNVTADTLQGQWHTLADSGTGNPLVGGSTNYIAKAWCFGTLAAAPVGQDGTGHTGTGTGDSTNGPLIRGTGFTCSGVGNQNDAQTDGIVMDVSFQAEQSRNNSQFLCSGLTPLNQTTQTLTITKIVNPGNDLTPAAVGDFTLQIDGSGSFTSGVANAVTAGAHTVSEINNDPDYVGVIGGDCAADGTVNVPASGTANCTITNTYQEGTLTVTKVVINDPVEGNGTAGTAVESDFQFSIDAGGATSFDGSGTNIVGVTAGSHSVVESADANYTTTYSNSQNANPNCDNLNVANGQNVTCTITNTFIDVGIDPNA